MTNVEKYLLLSDEADEMEDEAEYEAKADEAVRFRNENFTKEDWLELIAQSYGRAVYEYTKMMQERYPD